ncbi:hypothetical protein [Vibrio hepatarius]|uniref:hypothetical protein n=1 Tax=Vibrio hepatarius TaxID=171383 RepID=UPI00142E331E|nr:hypothetical protein [Vibrio hepatarius]NIY84075.1 hypothetical protein [Vibrio hepatarius]
MIKTKNIVKYILITSITAFLTLGGYYTYINFPSFTDYELTKPPEGRLSELISIASTNKTINSNLYAASTFQPNDPLFKAIIAIQQSRWYEAGELLKPLVDQGNADAMFWLGDITYRSSAFSGWNGAELFKRSAELGNPYSAIKLSPEFNSYQCKMRMRSYCDKKWGKAGLDILQERAATGDVKAAYAYLFYTRFDRTNFDYFNQFLEIVEDGIKKNYYRPLRQLVFMYQTREHLSPYNRDVIALTTQDRKVLANLLMVAALNNDIVSIDLLNEKFKDVIPSMAKFDRLVEQNLPLVDNARYFITYDYFLRQFNKSNKDREFLIRGYAYATLYDDYEGGISFHNRQVYEMILKDSGIETLNEQEKSKAADVYTHLVDEVSFVPNIDEVKGAWASTVDGY